MIPPVSSPPATAAPPQGTENWFREMWRELVWALAINTAIAAFLNILVFRGNGFFVNFVFSQSIGLTIYFLIVVLRRLLPMHRAWLSWIVAVPLGFFAGMSLAALLLDIPQAAIWRSMSNSWVQALAVSAVCTLLTGYFFWSRERIAAERAAAEHERSLALEREKQALEAQLKALQAQIEPHFLFNTLANVVSLIERDGRQARRMLEDLIDFLRSSLTESRTRQTTLGRQAELLESYLRLLRIRMGERLRYRIEVPAEAAGAVLPPMLLQPLVENSIKHGLEPKIEGGEVSVAAQTMGGTLQITIADTGTGLGEGQSQGQAGTGVGLANVRERLAALYGAGATLELAPNSPCGLKITLSLPLEYS